MEKESSQRKDTSPNEKIHKFFSSVEQGQEVTVRDDQFEFSVLLDALRKYRHKRRRFRLVDTGRFHPFQLEWLTGHGADLYTSDTIRSNAQELEIIRSSAQKGRALMAYFLYGSFQTEKEKHSLSFSDGMNLGRSGVYFHVSSRKQERDMTMLSRLAYECRKGGSWLVYYHHGPLDLSLVELGKNGAWVHISDIRLEHEDSRSWVRDIILSARMAGANLVLHWERGVEFSVLEDMIKAGAIVLFKSALFDFRSPFKALESWVKNRRLDYRAYYLYPTFLH